MPIYEYRCEKCAHELEVLQKMSDAPLSDCPACQTSNLKKIVSAAAFRLKGGGWYETDFKSGQRKNIAGGEKASSGSKAKDSAKNTSSDNKKSEQKPAASTT